MLLAASAVSRPTLRRLALTALAAATLGLSACGGGDRAEEYQPKAMLVFGDEHSAFTTITVAGGGSPDKTLQPITWAVDTVVGGILRVCEAATACDDPDSADVITEVGAFSPSTTQTLRYEVGTDADAPRTVWAFQEGTFTPDGGTARAAQRVFALVYDCAASSVWVKGVARSFGLGFGAQTDCSSDGAGATNYAEAGAKVADVISALQTRRGQMKEDVLVTVMVGHNDIIEQYEIVKAAGYTNSSIQAAEAVLAERGRALASAIKSVTDTGAKVILVKTPNLKRSPFAISEGRGSVLNDLSEALNQAVYVNPEISRLGRSVAGVDTNDIALVDTTTSGYTNEVAACDPALLFDPATNTLVPETSLDDMPRVCTSFTLKSGITPSSYIWATPRHLGPGAQSYIGSLAFNRAADQF